jgi:hypothetical protein
MKESVMVGLKSKGMRMEEIGQSGRGKGVSGVLLSHATFHFIWLNVRACRYAFR